MQIPGSSRNAGLPRPRPRACTPAGTQQAELEGAAWGADPPHSSRSPQVPAPAGRGSHMPGMANGLWAGAAGLALIQKRRERGGAVWFSVQAEDSRLQHAFPIGRPRRELQSRGVGQGP